MCFQALFLNLTIGVNAEMVKKLESSLSHLTDIGIIGDIDRLVDLWYGMKGAVTQFATWMKGRMDALENFMKDPQFSRSSAALQLPQDGKVHIYIYIIATKEVTSQLCCCNL